MTTKRGKKPVEDKKDRRKKDRRDPSIIIPTWPTHIPDIPECPVRNEIHLVPPLGELLRASGILMMMKEFNRENITPLVTQILEWNLMDTKHAPERIIMYINSTGGEVSSAWHLIDIMKQSRIPIHTVATGVAASSACLTLMAGAHGHRYVTHNSHVMSHVYSAGNGGKEHELEARMEAFRQTSRSMVNHYIKCTGKTEAYIREFLLPKQDVWLTPDECVIHGIADFVIETY